LLDLFVSNYVEIDLATAPKPSLQVPNCNYEGVPVNCGPGGLGIPITRFTETTEMEHLPMSRKNPAWLRCAGLTDLRLLPSTRMKTDGRTFLSHATPHQAFF
jgi:hypothetical protein